MNMKSRLALGAILIYPVERLFINLATDFFLYTFAIPSLISF